MRRYLKETHELYNTKDQLCHVSTFEHFIYDSEEERNIHCEKMRGAGYTDSGLVRRNFGTFQSPNIVWYGNYILQEAVISAGL